MSTQSKTSSCETCFQYEQMLQTVPSLIYVIDKKERLIHANPAVLTLLGLEKCDQLTGSFYEGLAEHSKWLEARIHSLRQTDLEVLMSETPHYKVEEPPLTDLRGLVFYYEATRVPLKNLKGQVVGLIVNLMDVTSQKMLEAKLNPQNGVELHKRTRPFPPNIHRDPSHPPRFLVIEDALPAQEAIRMVLTELGCEAEFVSSDAEFEQRFQVGKYDIVLMDIGLEGTSGYLMAKRIRQVENNSGYCVPIIALTGYDAELVKTDCAHYSMEGAITKPLSIEQARQIIQCYVYEAPVSVRGMVSLKQG